MKYKYQRKPGKCPKCGSKHVVRIVYGYPTFEARLQEDSGQIILGGCCIGNNDPTWQCIDCKTSVYKIKLRKNKKQ